MFGVSVSNWLGLFLFSLIFGGVFVVCVVTAVRSISVRRNRSGSFERWREQRGWVGGGYG